MEEKEPEVLTFRKIGAYLKRSILRIVVYVLVAMIIVSAVMGVYTAFGSNYEYQLVLVFNNKGIENGAGPWDSSLNVSGAVRTSYIVSGALDKCGYTEDQITSLTEKVLEHLTVTAIHTQRDEETPQNAFSYAISIVNGKSLGLGKTQTVQLLDEIATQYVADFRSDYSYKTYTASGASLTSDRLNYLQIANEFDILLDDFRTVVTNMNEINPTFRATDSKMTFAEMNSYLIGVQNAILDLRVYARENGIESIAVDNNTAVSGSAYIDQKILELTQQSASLQKISDNYTALVEQAAKHNPNITLGENGNYTINTSDPEFYALIRRSEQAKTAAELASAELKKWEGYKAQGTYGDTSKFATATPEERALMRATADAKVNAILQSLSADASQISADGAIIAKYNSAIAEYNRTELLKNGVRIASSARVVSTSPISTMVFLMGNIACALVAALLAIGVTNFKAKRAASNVGAQQPIDDAAPAPVEEPTQRDEGSQAN